MQNFSDNLSMPNIEVDEYRPKRVYIAIKDYWKYGVPLMLISGVILGLLLWFLPTVGAQQTTTETCLSDCISPSQLLLLVVLAGATGSAIHTMTSFATFAGNRQLVRSWLWWLYVRIPIGTMLALLVYVAVRAGVFGELELNIPSHIYFVILLAGLSGLFSRQVADKLSDLIDNLFMPSKPVIREDEIGSKVSPQIEPLQSRSDNLDTDEHPLGSDHTIQQVQTHLITLNYLPPVSEDGRRLDDGFLGPKTREAIERFLTTEDIVGEDRTATLGDEAAPDFWPKLLDLLEDARASKVRL